MGVRDYAFLPGPPSLREEGWTRAPHTAGQGRSFSLA